MTPASPPSVARLTRLARAEAARRRARASAVRGSPARRAAAAPCVSTERRACLGATVRRRPSGADAYRARQADRRGGRAPGGRPRRAACVGGAPGAPPLLIFHARSAADARCRRRCSACSRPSWRASRTTRGESRPGTRSQAPDPTRSCPRGLRVASSKRFVDPLRLTVTPEPRGALIRRSFHRG